METNVDEFAVSNAIDVVMRRDGANGSADAEVYVDILHKDVFGAIREWRHGGSVAGLQAHGIVEVCDRAVAHRDVLAFDVDAVGV